jgi:hypothetical protein
MKAPVKRRIGALQNVALQKVSRDGYAMKNTPRLRVRKACRVRPFPGRVPGIPARKKLWRGLRPDVHEMTQSNRDTSPGAD